MKKKILICGAAGMAGHMITRYLSSLNKYKIYTSAYNSKYVESDYCIDIEKNLDNLEAIIEIEKFDIIINCIGILVKEANNNPSKAIYINSFFPHWLVDITKKTNTKIIHLSTDCIFSGKKGNYTEEDIPDETNFYGRSKALGEIKNNKDLTIRMSIIGTELKSNGTGLLGWFLRQNGEIEGFTRAYWNGITTLELAKALNKIIQEKPMLNGLYQLAPDFNITKYNLLKIINKVFKKNLIIKPSPIQAQNKTLFNNRKDEFYYEIPSYVEQLINLKNFINSNHYKN